MRTLVAIALTLAALSRTGAADDRKCYAGTQTIDGEPAYQIVAVREVDRAASEIRQRVWSARNPSREVATTLHVAADGSSFDLTGKHVRGHGTLVGKPWAWTGYHIDATALGSTLTSDGKLTGDAMVVTTRTVSGGKTITARIEARAFDCAELEKRHAALDDIAPGAVRACYDGTLTDTLGHPPRRALLEQVIEPHQIKLVRRIAGAQVDTIDLLAISGTSIARTDPDHPQFTGSGALRGRPGAWTGYAWHGQLPLLRGHPPAPVEAEGSLGGGHATEAMVIHGPTDMIIAFAGDAFDCKDLAARRTALGVR